MTCEVLDLREGGRVIVCSRNKRPKKCQFCDSVAAFECDGSKPRKKSGSCDKRMCDGHRHKVGDVETGPVFDTVDLCPECEPAAVAQMGLFGSLTP